MKLNRISNELVSRLLPAIDIRTNTDSYAAGYGGVFHRGYYRGYVEDTDAFKFVVRYLEASQFISSEVYMNVYHIPGEITSSYNGALTFLLDQFRPFNLITSDIFFK